MTDASSDSTAEHRTLRESWCSFWFDGDESSVALAQKLRVAICVVAAIWFLTFIPNAAEWFGNDGLLPVNLAAKLVEFEERPAWQHWSSAWWINSTTGVRLYLLIASACAMLAAFGVGGSYTVTALILLVVGWIHRIVWLQGTIEPVLPSFLAYVALSASAGNASTPIWLSHLTVRLVQTHWWMLVAFGVAAQLGNIDWWQGDAAWWLAAYGRSHLLSTQFLSGQAWLVNGLTHGMIMLQAAALWLLLIPSARRIGIVVALLALGSIGLLADQTFYALLLAAGLIAFSRSPR